MKKALILIFSVVLLVLSSPVSSAKPVNVADATPTDHPIYPPV
ncbi:hypothetical protein PH210_24020 [Paenibacillus sp. BSR1-1]|nr:hypothetical protein [Paenibacillus sp. BSR1-1]MDN3019243.1 hypothetical protein [Paenibacillus sp. BSR1-1]